MDFESPGGPPRPGRVAARLARQVELALAGVDLTIAQYRLLFLLDEGKAAASALADKLAVSRPSVTAVVDGLVARGLVARDHDGDDRRRVGHSLTDAGRAVLATADAAVEGRLAEIAACHPADPGLAPPRAVVTGRQDGDGGPTALAALEVWREALDASRAAKMGTRA